MEPFVANQSTIQRIRQHDVEDEVLYAWWQSSKNIGIDGHLQAVKWLRLLWENMSDAHKKEICPSALFLERVTKGWYCNQKHPTSKQVHRQWSTLVHNGLNQLVFSADLGVLKKQAIVESIIPFFTGEEGTLLLDRLQSSIHDVSA